GDTVEEAEHACRDAALILRPGGEENVNALALLDLEAVGRVGVDEDRVRVGPKGCKRVLRGAVGEERVGEGCDAAEAGRVDRGEVRLVLVESTCKHGVAGLEDDGRGGDYARRHELGREAWRVRSCVENARGDAQVGAEAEARVGGLRGVVGRGENGEAGP